MKSIKQQVQGVAVSAQSFSLSDGAGNGQSLANCWAVTVNQGAIVRSGPVNTLGKARELLKIGQQIDEEYKKKLKGWHLLPFRMVCCQLASLQKEWNDNVIQDSLFVELGLEEGFSSRLIHFLLPTEFFYSSKEEGVLDKLELEQLQLICNLENVEGFQSYAYWIAEEMELVQESILTDSLDTYTLEAHMQDFIHEVRATMLRNEEWGIAQLMVKIKKLRQQANSLTQGERAELFNLEKTLLKAHVETRRRLTAQYRTLISISSVIETIEASHSNFLGLKRQAQLLAKLLGPHLDLPDASSITWVQQLFIMQLLHEEMGVISALNCNTGLDRTHLAFAIQLAVAVLKTHYSVDELIDLAVDWNKACPCFEVFQKCVLEILEKICVPIMRKSSGSCSLEWHETQKENPVYFELFPKEGEVRNKEGKVLKVNILRRDFETGNALGLTKAGHFLMTSLTSSV